MAAAQFRFPILSIDKVIIWLREQYKFQDMNVTEDDFKTPQPHRVQLMYKVLLEGEFGIRQEKILQAQFSAAEQLQYPEFMEEHISIVNLAMIMQRFMLACDVEDFKLKDITCPKPKRTLRMFSAIINFSLFKAGRMGAFKAIMADVAGAREQHDHHIRRIDQLKTSINNIKAHRADKEMCIKEMSVKVDELGAKMNEYKQEQATLQQDIHRIKTSISEKAAKQEQVKLKILNTCESSDKLRPQIIQSPDRIKTDMARIKNNITAGKKAKQTKEKRLQELKGQMVEIAELCEASEQGVQLISGINAELAKQKEAKRAMEKVRDHILAKRESLTDLTAKEAQLNQQIESKQEKLAKVQLQHQRDKEDAQAAIKALETDFKSGSQKQQKVSKQISVIEEKKALVRQQLAEGEHSHAARMDAKRSAYDKMLRSIDEYHIGLADSYEENIAAHIITDSSG